ncbi:MAG: endolytic transglycosylase MltG [Endomicrobium sp.]|nr:endolytic transglycosylase MltG [Endomicrobium sp.]
MAKKIAITMFVIIILFLAILFYLGFVSARGEKTIFTVEKGENFSTVASRLEEQNLIVSKSLFLFFIRITNSQGKLKAGIYELSGNDGMFKILKILKSNSKNFIKITIPEGNNIKQISNIIADKLKIDKDKFIKIASDKNLEGYLMPETYFVSPGISEQELINMMHSEFSKKITPDMYKRAEELKIPFKNIITMASIIEKEAVKPEERSVISAVFYNRLKKNMRLQSCATVLYATGVIKEHLSLEDIKLKSPYNTYLYLGLPPGPISNPGIQSIKAALYPANSDALFFVSAGDESHLFARTSKEHVKNKQFVKKKDKNKNKDRN